MKVYHLWIRDILTLKAFFFCLLQPRKSECILIFSFKKYILRFIHIKMKPELNAKLERADPVLGHQF